MRTIRVLHLASFDGNVGDNANHNGFYKYLKKIPGLEFNIQSLEIREFYRKKRFFDESFVSLANKFDLLIVGGGNYFELWVEHSPTGTSFMIQPDLFKKIEPPVFFNALGVDPGQGATSESCKKFENFLSIVLDEPKNFVSVRNDGSLQALKDYLGPEYSSKVFWTPDAGITVDVDDEFELFDDGRQFAAINLAGDMLETRFPGTSGLIDTTYFIRSFAKLSEKILTEGLVDELLFVPHIYKDLAITNSVLENISDSAVRSKISVAPLLHGEGAERKIFALYKNAKIALCMRFHANLCSIGLGTPTIGLCNYRQIDQLYREINLGQYLVKANNQNYEVDVLDKVRTISNQYASEKEIFSAEAKSIRQTYADSFKHVEAWLLRMFDQIENN